MLAAIRCILFSRNRQLLSVLLLRTIGDRPIACCIWPNHSQCNCAAYTTSNGISQAKSFVLHVHHRLGCLRDPSAYIGRNSNWNIHRWKPASHSRSPQIFHTQHSDPNGRTRDLTEMIKFYIFLASPRKRKGHLRTVILPICNHWPGLAEPVRNSGNRSDMPHSICHCLAH